MVSIDSNQRPAPRRFAASPALQAPTGRESNPLGYFGNLDTLVEPYWLTVPILSLLCQFLGSIGVQRATLTHPNNEVALDVLLDFLMQPSKAVSIPASRSCPLPDTLPSAWPPLGPGARSSIPRSQPPPPLPQLSSSAAAARPRLPLNVELWSFDGHICKAIGPDPIPVQYWVQRLADELAGQGFTQTDHGITVIAQGHFLRQLLKSPLSGTLITKLPLLPVVY